MSLPARRYAPVKRCNPSIDEMARDARALAGEDPRAWLAAFEKMLRCYSWRIVTVGRVYFHRDAVILEGWEIVRQEQARRGP